MKNKILYKFTIFFLIISLISISIPYSTYAYEEDNILKTDINNIEDEEEIIRINPNFEIEEIDTKKLEESIREKNNGKLPTHTQANTQKLKKDNLTMPDNLNDISLISIASAENEPFRYVCKLFSNGQFAGTGFLVGANLLLTANHCVFYDNGTLKPNLTFAPAYDYGYYNNLSCGWTSMVLNSAYFSNQDSKDDWSLVTLSQNLGTSMGGWIGCQAYGTNIEMLNLFVRSIGYPQLYGGDHQYYSFGNLDSVYDAKFRCTSTAIEGMSGGPIARWSDDYAVGINSKKEVIDGTNYTWGCRITQGIINAILDQQ